MLGENVVHAVVYEVLTRDLDFCPQMVGSARAYVTDWMYSHGNYNLRDVTIPKLLQYRKDALEDQELTIRQKRIYGSYLEQAVLAFLQAENPTLRKEVDRTITNRAVRNKLLVFLYLSGIERGEEISGALRRKYHAFLMESVAAGKVREYEKAMDQVKLATIREKEGSIRKKKFRYEEKEIFLGYHPDYQIAKSFYYTQDKEELYFDFSVDASRVLKHQVFEMLSWILENQKNQKLRRELYLYPLKLFFAYAVKRGIKDIQYMEQEDLDNFRIYLEKLGDTKIQEHVQILTSIRKVIFLSSGEVCWKTNVWFLERFQFAEDRCNPAREIQSISFLSVKDFKNRELLKVYMRYLLAVSDKYSIQTIRDKQYQLLRFLKFCDAKNWQLDKFRAEQLEAYVKDLDGEAFQAETYNKHLFNVSRFLLYLQTLKKVPAFTFYPEYYQKKVLPVHHDRMMTDAELTLLFAVLGKAPDPLPYMLLNLWGVGLRISEVCTLKGKSYHWENGDAWLQVYQIKMKLEKKVPIPRELYYLMQEYMSERGIGAEDYVFPGTKGGAYPAGSFQHQMQAFLKRERLEVIKFESHAFRHNIATDFYDAGVPVPVIRDYHGHRDEEMTKQYIDEMPRKVGQAAKAFFERSDQGE